MVWQVSSEDQRLPFRPISPKGKPDSLRMISSFFLVEDEGALVEVESQLMIAQNLGYFSSEQGQQLLDRAAELGKI
jgi:hypothetical protein